MSDDAKSRRASTSSNQSYTSQGDDGASRNILLGSSRTPLRPRQVQVSMFTGRSDGPLSPSLARSSETSPSVLSPGSIDRVFPVRSAVSIDPHATPMARGESGDGFPGLRIGSDSGIAARRDDSHDRRRSSSVTGTNDLPVRQPRTPTLRPSLTENTATLSAPSDSQDHPIAVEDRRTSDSLSHNTMRVDHHAIADILSDSASMQSDHDSSISGGMNLQNSRATSLRNEEGIITARFKHVVTDGGHAVITGRDGETLQRCEDEPIHIPGAVQSFGLLLAFREEDGKLTVRVASENSAKIIGYTPAQLFKLDNFLDILTEEQADNLLDHLDFIRDDQASDVVTNGPEVFMLSVRPPQNRTRKLWCAMHVSESNKDLVVCEFELEDDRENPLVAPEDGTPEPPEDTLGSTPTEEELHDSTVNISKPLRVLRSARKKRGEAAAMEVFNIMSQVQEQLANAPTLQIFLKVLIGVVKELCGFHRVMVYQFDQAWNGRVVAELVDTRATKDLYKGLNFPASDIPKQARELYKVNKVRLLYDRDQETSRLVCRTMEDLENPIDMTHGYLRAMSPIHTKYLANMAVRASMSISITAFNELWGLIACHSYGSKGMRVSFPIRKMCRLVGDTASRNIERLSYASRLQARKLINTTSSTANPSGYIVASSEDLLKLFDADVGALSIRDETKIMGQHRGHTQEILALVEFLRMRKINSVCSSQDINTDFPDLRYAPGLKFVAGVLYIPLSNGGTDFIAFFRRGVMQEVKWAGNPYEKFVKEGTEGYLEPRKSFKTWSETIIGRCRDWTEEEIETASVLCLVYGKFIDVWRQKEAALQSSQLTRLLLANSAHEVRTPLNHIINYLEIALEGSLDQETRDNLAKSHSASKSLVYVINDLLDLTKAEGGKDLVKEEPFDLLATLKEATDPFSGDAKRKGIDYVVHINLGTPARMVGDHRRVRQVVSNLIANAVQHTSTGHVRVEACSLPDAPADRYEIEIVVEDTGAGMSSSKVDMLFRELEEVSFENELPDVPLLDHAPLDSADGEHATLGLGLAVVARTIRAMNGQLRLKTEENKGSRFVIQLGFDAERKGESARPEGTPDPAAIGPSPSQPTTPGTEGEVTLIDRSTTPKRPGSQMVRRESAESVNSIASLRSGKSGKSVSSLHSNKSDADRLIDAIQEPLRLTDDSNRLRPESQGRSTRRRAISNEGTRSPPPKSNSIGSTRELKSAFHKTPGQENVTDSGVPVKPVRLPEEGMAKTPEKQRSSGRVLFDEPVENEELPMWKSQGQSTPTRGFTILVAEDDPINSRIMQKRLEKLGYNVAMTVNGEECASLYGEQSVSYDAILMDIQMPIVDGFSSTKMIRSFEKTQGASCLSPRASINGRTPIFAVSASLVERERENYIDAGFDGWILKPVDFKRLDLLLGGIVNDDTRISCLYQQGKWEQGGWFLKRDEQNDIYQTNTQPNLEKAVAATINLEDPSEGSITPTPSIAKSSGEIA